MREVIAPVLRAAGAASWCAEHQARGDLVAIVTATNEFVTRPIAAAFGVADLIAVELERDAGGWHHRPHRAACRPFARAR